MARVFIDGFESGATDLWDEINANVIGSPPDGMSGSYYLSGGYAQAVKTLGSSYSELYWAFKFRSQHSSTTFFLKFYDSNNTNIMTLSRGSTSYLNVRRGNEAATVMAVGTTPIVLNQTYLIELRYKPLDSGGIIQIKINRADTLDIDYSGDTTAGIQNIGKFHFNSGGYSYAIDDVVVDDAGWIGATKIQGQLVTGAGATAQWDPSAGANYQCVDERPYSDSDFNSTNVTNEVDSFEVGNLTGSIGVIKAVQVHVRCKYEGAPTPSNVQALVRVNGTDYPSGVDLNPGISFAPTKYHIWELNPDDSAAWEEADVNGMEIGYKAVA
jgi:hypothetical protein